MKKHIIFILLTVLMPLTLVAQTNPVMGTLLLNGKEIAAEYTISGTKASLGSGRNACIPHYSKGRVIVPKTITVDGTTYDVTAVSAMAFRFCTGITFIQLPEGVKRIGDFAFKGCKGLVSVSLPSTLESIATGAFIGLSSLSAIYCQATTPPTWEYNDVFCRHEGGISSTQTYSNTTTTLYVPLDHTAVYRSSAFSNADLGWKTPDGWGYFKTIKEANDYEAEWGLGISTPIALENFRQRVNDGDSFQGKIVKLEADIDMTDHEWDSGIGGYFKGTFDGQGHTISNLHIEVPASSNNVKYLGFFSNVLDNTITNVCFDNFYVISQSDGTLHTGIVAGAARNGTLSNIYVSNSSVYGSGHVGGLAGDAWVMTINKCVTDNCTVIHTTNTNNINVDYYGAGGLVGDTRKAIITNCAVINSRYPTSNSKSCTKGPFVGVNSSSPEDASTIDYCYCTSDKEYYAFVPDEEKCYYTHGEHVVMYGQEVRIPDQNRMYPITEARMKYFMYLVPFLGLDNWVYCVGQYPLPDCFEDRYEVKANHFSLRPATLTTPRPNALTPTEVIPADDWKTGAYRNASFITSSLYINDELSYNDRDMIPIGTATIECTNGVRYERTLTAPENGKRTTDYPVYQTDEEGMIVYDEDGHRIPTGETVAVEETVYEPTAYCFHLPYPLTFSNGIHLYQPTEVTVEGDVAQATFVEKTDRKAEAWQPYYAVVDAAKVSLSTEEHVTLTPMNNNNAVDAGNGYIFTGTYIKEKRSERDAYLLQEDKTWCKEGSDIQPFRAYFYSTNESQAAQITTFATLMLKNNEDNSEVIENNRGVTTNVTLQDRTLYKDGSWNTLCLPFNVALEGSPLEGATVMKLDATGTYATDKHTGFDASDGTLYLYFKDVSTLEAGKPYIVKWTKANDYDDNHSKYDIANPVFTDVTVTSIAPATVSAKNSGLNTVEFIGTYGPAALTGGDKGCLYLGADNKLYYPSADMTVRAFRAYFHVDLAGQPSGIRSFVLNFGGEETGILSTTNFTNSTNSGVWYSLDGRKLNGKPTTKGLYINNGKKVVIK